MWHTVSPGTEEKGTHVACWLYVSLRVGLVCGTRLCFSGFTVSFGSLLVGK